MQLNYILSDSGFKLVNYEFGIVVNWFRDFFYYLVVSLEVSKRG